MAQDVRNTGQNAAGKFHMSLIRGDGCDVSAQVMSEILEEINTWDEYQKEEGAGS